MVKGETFFCKVMDSWISIKTADFPDSNLNPFPNKPWFLRVCSTSLFKTPWEDKLLVTSNFPFSLSVFYPFEELSAIFIKFVFVVCKLFQFGRVQNLSFGKGLSTQQWRIHLQRRKKKIFFKDIYKCKLKKKYSDNFLLFSVTFNC